MATYDQLKFKILWKLYHHRYWGKRHTDIHNLPKGLPPHESEPCIDVAHDLIKNGWLLQKKTKRGLHISLNPRMVKEIKQFLET